MVRFRPSQPAAKLPVLHNPYLRMYMACVEAQAAPVAF